MIKQLCNPLTAKDAWGTLMWVKYGLGEHPSMAEIEPVAIQLFKTPTKVITGIELVMGRKVDVSEEIVGDILAIINPKLRFAAALLAAAIES